MSAEGSSRSRLPCPISGKADVKRRSKVNKLVWKADDAEKVSSMLLTEEMGTTLRKCNWVLRDVLLRKIRKQAFAKGVEVPATFGLNVDAPSRRKA